MDRWPKITSEGEHVGAYSQEGGSNHKTQLPRLFYWDGFSQTKLLRG